MTGGPGSPSNVPHGGRERPWWNASDVLLAIGWFMLAMIAAAIVTGTAIGIGGGTPLAEVDINAVIAGADAEFGTADDVVVATTTTDADGGFSLRDLPAGEYEFTPVVPAGEADKSANAPVAVTIDADADGDVAGSFGGPTPPYALFFGVLVFQLLQIAFPWLISKFKGLGIEEDWRFVSSLPSDIFIGMLMALFCFGGAWAATVVISNVVGLADPNEASNTDILIDNQGSIWLIGVIALVVVGAPIAEELLFRGFILRALQKNFGSTPAARSSPWRSSAC